MSVDTTDFRMIRLERDVSRWIDTHGGFLREHEARLAELESELVALKAKDDYIIKSFIGPLYEMAVETQSKLHSKCAEDREAKQAEAPAHKTAKSKSENPMYHNIDIAWMAARFGVGMSARESLFFKDCLKRMTPYDKQTAACEPDSPKTTGLTFTEAMAAMEKGKKAKSETVRSNAFGMIADYYFINQYGQIFIRFNGSDYQAVISATHINATDWEIVE